MSDTCIGYLVPSLVASQLSSSNVVSRIMLTHSPATSYPVGHSSLEKLVIQKRAELGPQFDWIRITRVVGVDPPLRMRGISDEEDTSFGLTW